MKGLKQCLLFPKTNCGCGLVTLVLALAWPAHGADPVLIGQWPGWPRGLAYGVAVSGNYAYVADGKWGLLILGPRPASHFHHPRSRHGDGLLHQHDSGNELHPGVSHEPHHGELAAGRDAAGRR